MVKENTASVLRNREIGGRMSKSTKHGLKITATKGNLTLVPQKDLQGATANERHARGVVVGESIKRENLKPTKKQQTRKNFLHPAQFGNPSHLSFSPAAVSGVSAGPGSKNKATSTRLLVPKRGPKATDVISKETPKEKQERETVEHAKRIRLEKKHFKEKEISQLRKKAINRNIKKQRNSKK